MAKAFITEHTASSPMQGDDLVPVIGDLVTTQAPVTFTTSTQSAAFGSGTDYIEFTVDADGHFAIGSNPTATTNSARIWAKERLCRKVEAGQKIAFITG